MINAEWDQMLFPFPEKAPIAVKKESMNSLSFFEVNLNCKLSLRSTSGFNQVTNPDVYPPDPDQMFLKGGSTVILGAGSWITP